MLEALRTRHPGGGVGSLSGVRGAGVGGVRRRSDAVYSSPKCRLRVWRSRREAEECGVDVIATGATGHEIAAVLGVSADTAARHYRP